MLKYLKKKYDAKRYNCWHLVLDFYKNELKIDLPKFQEDGITMSESLDKVIKKEAVNWKKLNELKKHCVLVFSNTPPYSDHVGVYLGNNKFIQNLENANVVVSDLNVWKIRLVGAYEYIQN